VKLTIDIPDEALSALRETLDRFATELRFAAAVHWYHQGRLGASMTAQVAGVTRLEFLDKLAPRSSTWSRTTWTDSGGRLPVPASPSAGTSIRIPLAHTFCRRPTHDVSFRSTEP
jgi:hypothetical protein